MKINANNVDAARASRLAARHGNDPVEVKRWFRESFRPYSKAANRKDRRSAKRVLRDLALDA